VLHHAVGVWAVDEAIDRARKERIPREADATLWCLERFLESCQRLAERIGRSDFPLPLRTVGRILEVDAYEAWKLIHALVLDGVLEKTGTGEPGHGGGSGVASRWRYTRPRTLFDQARWRDRGRKRRHGWPRSRRRNASRLWD
jgi:hypothetical protein